MEINAAFEKIRNFRKDPNFHSNTRSDTYLSDLRKFFQEANQTSNLKIETDTLNLLRKNFEKDKVENILFFYLLKIDNNTEIDPTIFDNSRSFLNYITSALNNYASIRDFFIKLNNGGFDNDDERKKNEKRIINNKFTKLKEKAEKKTSNDDSEMRLKNIEVDRMQTLSLLPSFQSSELGFSKDRNSRPAALRGYLAFSPPGGDSDEMESRLDPIGELFEDETENDDKSFKPEKHVKKFLSCPKTIKILFEFYNSFCCSKNLSLRNLRILSFYSIAMEEVSHETAVPEKPLKSKLPNGEERHEKAKPKKPPKSKLPNGAVKKLLAICGEEDTEQHCKNWSNEYRKRECEFAGTDIRFAQIIFPVIARISLAESRQQPFEDFQAPVVLWPSVTLGELDSIHKKIKEFLNENHVAT